MEGILIILVPFVVGALLIAKSSVLAEKFCALGKRLWKASTFGATDMALFYREKDARLFFRATGVIFISWSVIMFGIAAHSLIFT